MKNEFHPHKVVAVYPGIAEAEAAVTALIDSKNDGIDIIQLAPGAKDIGMALDQETETTSNTITKDTAIGSIAGTATGAAVAGAVALVSSSLFISAPVVAPLILLGYGTLIGGIVGALRGPKLREGQLAGLVKDALDARCHAVIVHAENEKSRDSAQEVINLTMTDIIAHT
ncbi:MAG: hypothetical protein RQ936_07550 [Gammaproteobacteria bacterium]|nr:hypothetical protein [Gammaproteobacteria bacterium]